MRVPLPQPITCTVGPQPPLRRDGLVACCIAMEREPRCSICRTWHRGKVDVEVRAAPVAEQQPPSLCDSSVGTRIVPRRVPRCWLYQQFSAHVRRPARHRRRNRQGVVGTPKASFPGQDCDQRRSCATAAQACRRTSLGKRATRAMLLRLKHLLKMARSPLRHSGPRQAAFRFSNF